MLVQIYEKYSWFDKQIPDHSDGGKYNYLPVISNVK
jgi:hypothetical protein